MNFKKLFRIKEINGEDFAFNEKDKMFFEKLTDVNVTDKKDEEKGEKEESDN